MEITNELQVQALYYSIANDKNSEYYFQKLIENCINYAKKHNYKKVNGLAMELFEDEAKANWTARELFKDVLEEDLIEMLFDEK